MKLDTAVQLAIDNVLRDGVDDVFDRPAELDFLNEPAFRAAVAEEVTKALGPGGLETLSVGPIQHANVPKSGLYAFRRCALIQPMDHIKYLALVLQSADLVEMSRLPIDKRRLFSYRFSPKEGRLFDPAFSLNSFHEEARRRAASSQVVVRCDIANFYDRLNLHRLESTLATLGLEQANVRATNELLIYWSRKDSYGLPVGMNASRILAEAALIETDRYLESIGAEFIRFVDDYQFFANNMAQAQFWLYKLIGRLAQEGLGLNSYKTRIIESKSAMWNTEKSDDPSNVHFKPVTGVHIVDEVDDRGFYTRVPRRFFIPEMREFTTPPRPANVIVDSILEHTVVEAAEFRELALALSSSGTFDVLKRLIPIVEKHPAYIDYLMGMLAHFGPNITKPLREVLSKQLGQLLNSETFEMPEWHRIQIVRVLGSESFRNREAILLLLRRMSRSSGSALGRAVFDAIYNFATRGDAIEVRDYFERADPAERRAILRILNKVLPTEEARAWSKYAYHQVRDDLFALHYVRPLKQKS